MAISTAAYERSVVRSRLRRQALLTLSSLGEAFPRQLARAIGVDTSRLRAILHGAPPRYSEGFSLCGLGLAVARFTPQGRVYAITEAGRRKARQLTSRSVRREEARRQRRKAKEGAGEGSPAAQVHPHLHAPARAGVPTPEAEPPDRCTYTWRV